MARKIRILFAIPNFITAGSGREMFNIIEQLDKNIFEPMIAVQQAGGKLYDEIIDKGYTIIEHRFIEESQRGLANKLREAGKNSQFFKQFNIDIWQSFHWSSDFTEALTARWCGAKYVYVKKSMNWNRKAWKVKSLLADAIIARNTTLLNTVFNKPLFKRKTHFITGAVDVNKFVPAESNFRAILNLPEYIKVVICVAQLIKVKDQATLIKAIAQTNNTYLVLVGAMRDEAYLKEIKELINELHLQHRVNLYGYGNDTANLINGSDVFVLPTSKYKGHEEGCPVALLEAMACGAACIASDVAGSNDLIIDNITGLLFEAGNDTQLAERIIRLANNRQVAKELGAAAREKVLKEHTLVQEVQAFTKLYKQLAGIA